MYPSILAELIGNDSELNALGITPSRIKELQSQDKRPFESGYFLIFNWQESTLFTQTYTGMQNGIPKAPRVLQLWVHTPWDRSRNYRPIDAILNRVDALFDGVEHATGADGVRVTMVRKAGRSANLTDEGWKTIARNATYGVLYDESAA